MIFSLFFELIRVSLHRADRLTRVPSLGEWQLLFALSRRQALEGMAYQGVERLPVEQQPPKDFVLQWYGLVKKYERVNLKMNQRAVEATAYFKERGFNSCLLKGQGVALYYPQPLWRIPGDIDLWLEGDREDIYRTTKKSEHFEGLTYLHVNFSLFKDTSLEVHVTPSWMSSPFLNHQLQRYFKGCWNGDLTREVSLPGAAGTVNVPSDEFNRFYLLLHIYHHLFGQGVGLRQLMDYYYVLLAECDEASLQRTRDLFQRFHLMKFVSAVMYVEQKVFGLPDDKLLVPVNVEEGEFLLSEILQAGNFGKYDKRIDRKKYKITPYRFVLSVERNLKFAKRYPQEVLWDPFFRMWTYAWRWWKR